MKSTVISPQTDINQTYIILANSVLLNIIDITSSPPTNQSHKSNSVIPQETVQMKKGFKKRSRSSFIGRVYKKRKTSNPITSPSSLIAPSSLVSSPLPSSISQSPSPISTPDSLTVDPTPDPPSTLTLNPTTLSSNPSSYNSIYNTTSNVDYSILPFSQMPHNEQYLGPKKRE